LNTYPKAKSWVRSTSTQVVESDICISLFGGLIFRNLLGIIYFGGSQKLCEMWTRLYDGGCSVRPFVIHLFWVLFILMQVVLDISTKTCGPCKIIFPKVVQLSIEYPDVMFLKINGDTSADTRALMRKWGVRAVPNFRFFRNGELVHSHTGAKLDELKAHLESHNNAAIKT
jgi:thioredoxin 1